MSDEASSIYVADTHALIWFITKDLRLPRSVEIVLQNAEESLVQVLIPTIVLAEITHIAERRHLGTTIYSILEKIETSSGFVIVPFDTIILKRAIAMPEAWEIHDRVIAATASYYSATLLTRDFTLQKSETISTLWD